MTPTEVAALTDAQLAKVIADIGDHPFAERFVREQQERAGRVFPTFNEYRVTAA